jgi:hypothetical protein
MSSHRPTDAQLRALKLVERSEVTVLYGRWRACGERLDRGVMRRLLAAGMVRLGEPMSGSLPIRRAAVTTLGRQALHRDRLGVVA